MKYKKIMILTMIIVTLLAVGTVSAADNTTDDIISTDVAKEDVVSLDEDIDNSISVTENNVKFDERSSYNHSIENDNILSLDENSDVLSSLYYSDYSVSVENVTFEYGTSGSIKMSIIPSSKTVKYNYYLKIYDSNNVEKISMSYNSIYKLRSETYNLLANSLPLGMYTIKIINKDDNYVMDTAQLYVYSVPYYIYSVRVKNVSSNYDHPSNIEMYILNNQSSYRLPHKYSHDFYLKVYNSNNVEIISKRFYGTSSNNPIRYSLPENLPLGDYTIKILNNGDNYVMASAKLQVYSVPYYAYSVSVNDISINYGFDGLINMSISPSISYKYQYDFYLKVYDSNNVEKISQRYYSTDSYYSLGPNYSQTYTLSSKSLNIGVYTIKIISTHDNHIMSTSKLTIHKIGIQYVGITGNCTDNIQYKVRVSENEKYAPGLKVIFTCNGEKYNVNTDDQGYATLKIHLKADTYDITAECDGVSIKKTIEVPSVYVKNDYKNIHIESVTDYYNGKNTIIYGWEGNFEGYFKIYKANKLVYETKLNTNCYVSDYMYYLNHNYYFECRNINSIGTYKAVITDVNGNELDQATIKITKAPTHAKGNSLTTGMGGRDSFTAYIYDKSNSNKGIGGTAKFKMFGKTYKVKVKNGVATVKRIKLPLKAKTYNCKVIFSGDKNYKGSSTKFKIKLSKANVVILNKNRSMKIGKYTIKLTSGQYKSLVNAFNKDKTKVLKLKTDCKYNVKGAYTKTIHKYTTTKSCKTFLGLSYYPTMNKMKNAGWSKVSEYTYTVKNPQNQYGIGLSAYTYAITKWVKTSYTTVYKTNSYPVYAKIIFEKGDALPGIGLYSQGKYLDYKYIAIE